MRFIRISPDHHRVRHRQRAAGQRGAGAARHHAHAFSVAEAHHRGDLLGRVRQHDGERRLAIGGQAVGLVRLQAERFGDHRVGGQQRAQAGDDGVAARQNVRFRFRLSDHDGENGPATRPTQATRQTEADAGVAPMR